jgi:uncharacterized protein (TIGR02145 family)
MMKTILLDLFIAVIISLFGLSCESDPISSSNSGDSNLPEDNNNVDPLVITDIDGNEYQTVRIGSQLWTVGDLRTTKYNDGSSISLVTEDTAWSLCVTDAYCSYKNDNNSEAIRKYGLIYNWYAVNTGKLAPVGWRVPTIDDWNTLRDYLISNGYNWDGTTSGDKVAKAIASQTEWKSCDTAGTIGNDLSKNNKSGFTALPDGSRYANGIFGNRGLMSHWWSSTPTYASRVFAIFLSYENQAMEVHNQQKTKGFAVRIIKEN